MVPLVELGKHVPTRQEGSLLSCVYLLSCVTVFFSPGVYLWKESPVSLLGKPNELLF